MNTSDELEGLGLPSFGDFFEQVSGHEPYLWQAQLAEAFDGRVPDELDVPTGMGKTSIILCWLWAFARDQRMVAKGLRTTRKVPTRLHLVVDRRVLVDSAADVADELAAALVEADAESPVGQVAAAIAHLAASDGTKLSVRRLRGGRLDEVEHVRDPKVPAVVTSTIDMLGSRLLWRGYGLSRGRRSIDAALVGADSLIVLDEAHLVPQFRSLLGDLSHQQATEDGFGALPPRHVVVMTATQAGNGHGVRLTADMTAEKRLSPWLAERRARRDGVLVAQGREDLLAEVGATPLPGAGESMVVFVNSVKAAVSASREVARIVKDKGAPVDVVTVLGGVPEPVRLAVMARLGPYMTGAAGRADARGLVVVSTQGLEVGADLDFDWGISELAAVPAMVQRVGRINRVGAREGGYMVVVPYQAKRKDGVPVEGIYADCLSEVERFMATLGDRAVRLDDFLSAYAVWPNRAALSTDIAASELVHLSPAEFGELVDTANEVTAEPVSSFLRTAEADWRSQVVFRRGVDKLVAAADDQAVATYLEQVPIRRWESWSMGDCSLLQGKAVLLVGRDASVRRIESFDDRFHRRWQLAGCTLVVEPDESLAAKWVPGFGLEVRDQCCGGESRCELVDLGKGFDLGDPDALEELAVERGFELGHHEAVVLLDDLVLFVEVPVAGPQVPGRRVTLAEHNRQVGDRASQWAQQLRLPEAVVEAIRVAGHRHDLGKADEGFQYLLHLSAARVNSPAPVHRADGLVLAKSDLPRRLSRTGIAMAQREGGLQQGFRHEALSAQLCEQMGLDEDMVAAGVDLELVVYLVATHHGHYRGIGPVVLGDKGRVVPVLQDSTSADWGRWPARVMRLQRRYGPYTLALAEAVVRLADWECSAWRVDE